MKKEVTTRKNKIVRPKSSVSNTKAYERALKVSASAQSKKLSIEGSSKKNILKFITENLALN